MLLMKLFNTATEMNQNALKNAPSHPLKTQETQLPVQWYVDDDIYALEQQHLFSSAANYIGHRLMVPNSGDYQVLPWTGNAKILVHAKNDLHLMSNICRHRQAVMLTDTGNAQNIVCPLHRWTYDLQGTLLGAPHFDENPCLHLRSQALQEWQGLLFDCKHSIADTLANLGCKDAFNFTGFQFESMKVEHYPFNWKTFMEAYLEDYHVGSFHPGLNQFVDCDALSWDFGAHFSAQTVGFKSANGKTGSAIYEKWHQAANQFSSEQPKHGAIWFALYPFVMIEWYPNVLVVSHLIPQGTHQCTNVTEFYYPEEIALFEPDYIKAQQDAYFETALEDKEICQRMHDGRRALYAQGIDERGPYQHPMETGLAHFHAWYRSQMEAHLS